jgi:hypothetical protein
MGFAGFLEPPACRLAIRDAKIWYSFCTTRAQALAITRLAQDRPQEHPANRFERSKKSFERAGHRSAVFSEWRVGCDVCGRYRGNPRRVSPSGRAGG